MLPSNKCRTAEDILNDKLVRIIGVEFAHVLRDLISPKDASSMPDNPVTDLCLHIIETPKLLEVYVKALGTIMNKNDADCKSVAIQCLLSLLPRLIGR